MEKCERVLRCYHCGAILQSNDPELEGYCDEKVIAKGPNKIIYCNKCYETMISLNTSPLDLRTDEDILKILDDAVASDAVILWVVDLFSFNGVINADIAKKVRKLKTIICANKLDLLPFNVNKKKLENYLVETFTNCGVKPFGVKFFGNTEKLDIHSLLDELSAIRQGHDVYVIGSSMSGKTTIINKMLKSFYNKSKRPIRSFEYPGTEAKVLEVPLTNSAFLYELPGISRNNSLVNKVEKDVLQFITPKKNVRIASRILLPNEYLMIGSLAAFSLVSGKPTGVKFFSAEGVETRKVRAEKLTAALAENSIKKNLRPVSDRFSKFTDFDIFDYYMENDGLQHDICIEGLGWLSFKALGQVIRVTAPKGTALSETIAKIG